VVHTVTIDLGGSIMREKSLPDNRNVLLNRTELN
jgi:hypothetical protein